MEGVPFFEHQRDNDHELKVKIDDGEIADDTYEEPDVNEPDYVATEDEVFDAIKIAYEDKYLEIKLLGLIQKILFERTGKPVLNGINAKGFLLLSLEKIVSRERAWKKNRLPNIVHLIIFTARSWIRNEIQKKNRGDSEFNGTNLIHDDLMPEKLRREKNDGKKKRTSKKPKLVPLFTEDAAKKEAQNTIADVERARSYKEDYFGIERENGDFENMIAKTETQLEDDEVAYFVFQEKLEGVKSNIEIATKYGLEVREVENALKRLKRVTLK